MFCGLFRPRPVNRREMLRASGSGLGAVALSALLADDAPAADRNPLAPKEPHFEPSATSVIFLYMDGGPSHVDTWDYKPALEKHNGKDPRQALGKLEPTQFNNIGRVMKSPWNFKQYGECGRWCSDLFPHVAQHVDKLCLVHSMVSKFPEHTFANYFLHTGSGLQGRPSMGAWIGYGLGSENQNLPGFVVLNGGLIPPGGLDNFTSGFLPASYQGSVFNPGGNPVANVTPTERSRERQQRKLELLSRLDSETLAVTGAEDRIESAIANYETAFRMQTAIPELLDLTDESQATQSLYGIDAEFKNTQTFGRQCLIARRLVERGVRFIELTCPNPSADRWDQHGDLVGGHTRNAKAVDRPMAGLLTDLAARGLLEKTLIVWSGEFGRTPFAQGSNGRDHNPLGYSCWLAGGGIRGGMSYGATDEFGYRAVSDRVEVHDLHATMLHLLGLDHTRTTFRFSSRDMRLTDVHGHVRHEWIA